MFNNYYCFVNKKMKKLLTILLLFTIHGAWAEVINLSCITYDTNNMEHESHFIIDTETKKITNSHGVPMHNTGVSEQQIVFEFKPITKPTALEFAHTSINRVTGKLRTTFHFKHGTNTALYGQCEKSSDKKKF